MKSFKDRKNYIYRGDAFDFAFAEYFFGDNKKVVKFFNEKKHRLDSNVSYRVINHWEEKGLLASERSDGTGWRKYSLLDIVWVHIIVELRKFGFSLEKILLVKEDLFMSDKIISPFPELELFAAYTFAGKEAILAVFANGEAMPLTVEDFKDSGPLTNIDNCIIISINDIMHKIFPNKKFHYDNQISLKLSNEEMELILAVRLDNWTEIRIRGEKGKMNIIERTENINVDEKIVDILSSGKFQDIEVKQEGGKIVLFKRTERKKL